MHWVTVWVVRDVGCTLHTLSHIFCALRKDSVCAWQYFLLLLVDRSNRECLRYELLIVFSH